MRDDVSSEPDYDAFISYSGSDNVIVRRIADFLQDVYGLRVFFDAREIQAGTNFPMSIEAAVGRSRSFVLALSPSALQSGWVQLERTMAQNLDPAGARGFVIPLLISDCDIPLTLSVLQHIDFRDPALFEEKIRELAELLRSRAESIASPKPRPFSVHPAGLTSGRFTAPHRTVDFVGREEELKAIRLNLTERSAFGLVGLPGVGKSALAKEYAYRFQTSYPDGVLWIAVGQEGSSTNVRLNPAGICHEVSRILGLKGIELIDLEHGRSYMAEMLGNLKCLLVLDNVIDPSYLYCLPPNSCHTLITARTKGLITDAGLAAVHLNALPREESELLLARRLAIIGGGAPPANSYKIHGGLPLFVDLLAKSIARGQPISNHIPQTLTQSLDSMFDSLSMSHQRLLLPFGIAPLARTSVELISALSGEAYGRAKNYLDELAFYGLVTVTADGYYNLHVVLKNYLYERIERSGLLRELKRKYGRFYGRWCKANWHEVGRVQEELYNILQAFHWLLGKSMRWQCQLAMYVWSLEVAGIDHLDDLPRGFSASVSLLQQLYPNSFTGDTGDDVNEIIRAGLKKDLDTVSHLQDALSSPAEEVRWAACWALGQIGADGSVPLLVTITKDKSWFVGWAAAEALSNYPVKEAEDHLASLLWEERLRLRGAAIDALSAMRAMDKLPVIETFTDSEVPVLRARAASALVKMGSGSQISKCRELLKDPNPWVRAVAARSLKTRGEQSA